MPWWERNNLRLIQTNLREVDAAADVDRLIADVKEYSANVLMVNAGGIFAFYPTELEYHYRTPYLKGDFLGEVVGKAHRAGMRVIARFDFSKAHESIFARRPEWFYRTKDGREINYHGIVHTCLNGGYQQEYSLRIIGEVLDRYPVDGVFFNMFGYQTSDYSGNEYGFCYCDNCRRRFREMFGLELPASADPADPAYAKYREFQWITARDMLDKIHAAVKSRSREIAISTYSDHKVDIVRNESNTKLTRPHPVWPYSASENVKSIEDTFHDKLISNCCINAVDLPYRYMGVSRHEVAVRLYENIASGSGLDFCINGVFADYPDRENLQTVKEIFRFHRDHEAYFGELRSTADIALVKPMGSRAYGGREYLGIFKMLKESHTLFDVICQHHLPEREGDMDRYRLVIVPDIRHWEDRQLEALRRLQERGVRLLATGWSFTRPEHAGFLKDAFDAEAAEFWPDADAAYLHVADKRTFPGFAERDWVFIAGEFACVRFGPSADTHLPLVLPSTYGPPEKAYGHRTGEFYGAGVSRKSGRGDGILVPWQAGTLYYRHGYEDHKRLLLSLVDLAVDRSAQVSTDAPGCVELFWNRTPKGEGFLQLLNLSGFNGVTWAQPLPVGPIRVRLKGFGAVSDVTALKGGGIAWEADPATGDVTIVLERLLDYEAIAVNQGTGGT